MGDLAAFVAVARAKGFRDAARATSSSASGLSDAVRRLESKLGVRLLNRSTRSVVPTEAGASLLARLDPVLSEVDSALDVINGFRDTPTGTLRLNVPMSAARLVLPSILPRFFAAYPEIRVEVIAEESFVDVFAAGCDAGIRYEERLEQDMLAVPIGPRVQRMAAAASRAYLARRGCPAQPHELLDHTCMRARFASGALVRWQFTKDGETITIDPSGPLLVQVAALSTWPSRLPWPAPASSISLRTGCGPTSIAACSNPCWSHGGRASPVHSSTIRVGNCYQRHCARLSILFGMTRRR